MAWKVFNQSGELLVNALTSSGSSDGPVILAASDADFPDGRVITAGNGITLVDGGAGNTMTINADSNIDGGSANSVYLIPQNINGGNA